MEKELLIKYTGVDVYQQDSVVLKDVELEINRSEFIYLVGKVGSGKSSLLKSFYYEVPISGVEAQILEYDLLKMKRRKVPFLRRRLGIIYQDLQLLNDRSVEDNLVFALKATGWKNKAEIKDRIEEVLKQVGMYHKNQKMPHQLSGGEQQRIVIARALLNSPDIILADEPTGHLDWETGTEIVQLLYTICQEQGTTVIMSTHNVNWPDKFSGRVLHFENEKMWEENK
jgi:cell division transport system ATP-binding protein